MPGRGAHFRVWAPKSYRVAVMLGTDPKLSSETQTLEMKCESEGIYSVLAPEAKPGMYYKIRLDHGTFPDPVSRFQPQGPHGPSQIVDPTAFHWTDQDWKGVRREGQVVYEMHIGTFTREGTYAAAAVQLE